MVDANAKKLARAKVIKVMGKDIYTGLVAHYIEEVQKAVESSWMKFGYTKDTWQERGTRRLLDLFYGDMATRIVATIIRELLLPPEENLRLQEYDDFRRDGFREEDKYDIKVIGPSSQLEIDVKSSLLKERHHKGSIEETIKDVIKHQNLIAYPGRFMDIHIQLFYYRISDPDFHDFLEHENFDEEYGDLRKTRKGFENFLEKTIVGSTGFFIPGFALRSELDERSSRDEIYRLPGRASGKEKKRSYVRFPLSECRSLTELLKVFNVNT